MNLHLIIIRVIIITSVSDKLSVIKKYSQVVTIIFNAFSARTSVPIQRFQNRTQEGKGKGGREDQQFEKGLVSTYKNTDK